MTAIMAEGLDVLRPPRHAAWEPRRAITLSAARRRTRFVRILRFALIAAAAAILAAIVYQLAMNAFGAAPAAAETVGEEARMVNPRFTGRDGGRTPFTVTADLAIRRAGDAISTTLLERPRLDFDMIARTADAEGVLAERGIYDAETQSLDLETDVHFTTRTGYEFVTQNARVHFRENRITGDSPVRGSGPMGSIQADGYEIIDGGHVVVFIGNVSARLNSRREASGNGAETEDTP